MKDIERIKRLGKETNIFYFKQFSVKDDRSTMRVGTDAVLLGAAVNVKGAKSILEIGTGCGIIALALAQRSEALIDALEVDDESVIQAKQNVEASPWKGRIEIIHCPLQEFLPEGDRKYDLIVSNPPYFSGTFKSFKSKRNISRHNERLTFDELIEKSDELLNDAGSLWIILPVKESLEFIDKAQRSGFFLNYLLKIIPKTGKVYNRVIIQLKREEVPEIKIETLTHWNANGSWAGEFKRFTGDFYIDF